MVNIILHIQNEDPVLGELDEMPGAMDVVITVKNPHRRDGKDIPYLDASVTTVVWPMSRVNFIEVLPGQEEEEIISSVREK
ncbi:MAG: hypothetical protein LWX83_12665 [Anaerolineae bacterium]|nr:hypothetical protein [Anaerolineae bacterium]